MVVSRLARDIGFGPCSMDPTIKASKTVRALEKVSTPTQEPVLPLIR